MNEIDEAKRFPKAAKGYEKHYSGYDHDVETHDGKTGAHVFTFKTDKDHEDFLHNVGGAPHPLGGRRVILREGLDEAVLSVAQRQKRAQIMRRYQAKIERAREMAKKRLAPQENIKKRAYAQARQIVRQRVAGKRGAEYEKLGPSEKIAIDRAVEGKQKLIKKIALRLIPRVKSAEQQRLHTFMKGQALQNHGQPEGKTQEGGSGHSSVREDFNQIFAENFPPMAERSERKQPQETTSTTARKKGGKEVKGNQSIIQYNKFEEERDCNSSAYKAIAKKAHKSGISEDILGEVYDRGMDAWYEETGVSQQQYAFARVNSYINQGKTYFNEDSDLHEGMKEKIKGVIRREKVKDMPLVQNRRDYAAKKAGEAYEKGDEKKGRRYMNWREKSLKKEDVEIDEGMMKPYVKPHYGDPNNPDKQTGWKSANKHGKTKYWQMFAKNSAEKHAGVDKINEGREVELHDGGPSRNIKKATLIGNHKTQKDHVIIRTHDYLGKPKDLVIHKDWIKEEAEMSLYDKIQAKRAEMRKNPEPEKEPPYKRKPALTAHDRDRRRLDREDDEAQAIIRKRLRKEEVQQTNESWINSPIKWKEAVRAKHGDVTFKRKNQPGVLNKSDTHATNSDGKVVGVYQHHNKMGRVYEEVQQTNENFMDGKGPGKPGDSARHGLKGKSASELRKIRSSETASPRKKQLAHWLLNMHHNESVDEGLKDPEDNPCWKGYKPVGTKKKAGKTVPNCVPEAVEKVVGTNCRNCSWWKPGSEKPVTKEELNKNGGLKAPNDEYIAMTKRIDLGTLPGEDHNVKVKGFCEHKVINDWVTERMCCSQWDSDGMIRDYKGQSPVMKEEGESIVPQTTSTGSKARRKIEKVDRAAPHTEHGKQQAIQKKIIDEEGNSQPDPKKRLVGTDSLVKAYKKDTPGQSLDESFNIAFAAGVGVTLTAADLGMRAQGAFALHPSVIEEMEKRQAEEVEEEVRSADVKGVVVRTATGKTVVRRQKANRKIIGSGNLTDGKPDDTL